MDYLLTIDVRLFTAINGLAGRWRILDGVGIYFSTVLIFFLFAALAVYLAEDKKRRWIPFFSSLASAFVSWGASYLIGVLYYRPRPFLEIAGSRAIINVNPLSKSFPSSHASIVFGLAFGLFLWNRKWGAVFLAIASCIALGRVFVGVHYPSDVFFGMVLGAGSAFAVHRLTHLLFKKKIKEIIV
jgi:undecaprenyl-diphosphatase